jgi:hypothetical protein
MNNIQISRYCHKATHLSGSCRDRNWEVQPGSPDKIFDKNMSICLTKL